MSNKKKITTLFLDIGGVLLSDGWGHAFRKLAAEKFQIDETEMEKRHGILFATYEEGKLTVNEYLDRVVFFRSRDFTPDEFRNYMFSLSSVNLEMVGLIKQLKLKYGLKIVAVSNEARELNAFRIHHFRLNSFIDFFISSCYVQIRKPDKAIFRMALDTAQVSPDEVLYIDDVQMFVDIATGLGIESIHHMETFSTAESLKKWGLHPEKNWIHA